MNNVNKRISPDVMITSIYQVLTKSEQKVADVVKDNLKESVYWSVSDLAEYAAVGETTVIRFCRKLGYRGYQDFKLSVAQNMTELNNHEDAEVKDTDSISELSQKITTENRNTLQNTLSLIESESIRKSSLEITKSRKVYLFGVGASGIMAHQAQYRFMRLGFNSIYSSDSHVIAMNCSLAGEGDVVFGISMSGSTKDLVDAIEIAKKNGAYVICLTNHMKSPITKFADIVLLTSARENPLHGGAFSSLISQMHVLDILTRYIGNQQKDRSRDSLQKTAKSVSNKLY